MKAPSFLPLKLKRKINSILRALHLQPATTRKVATKKSRKSPASSASVSPEKSASAGTDVTTSASIATHA